MRLPALPTSSTGVETKNIRRDAPREEKEREGDEVADKK